MLGAAFGRRRTDAGRPPGEAVDFAKLPPMIDLDTRVRVPENLLFCDLDGEGVLLELDGGCYFGLDEVGNRIWKLLQKGVDLQTAFDTLLAEYEVSAETLRADLVAFVTALAASGLVTVDDG